jgi:hypothetical protein
MERKPSSPPSPAPATPTQPVRVALAQSEPLARLMERVAESKRCLELVGGQLPPALRAQVRPGPLDERGWALLVPNAAVAAKLRQSLPLLAEVLQQAGRAPGEIRVRILPPAP